MMNQETNVIGARTINKGMANLIFFNRSAIRIADNNPANRIKVPVSGSTVRYPIVRVVNIPTTVTMETTKIFSRKMNPYNLFGINEFFMNSRSLIENTFTINNIVMYRTSDSEIFNVSSFIFKGLPVDVKKYR